MKLEELSTERLREEKRKIEAELSKRHKTYEDENVDCKWLRDNVKQKLLDSLAEESAIQQKIDALREVEE